MFNSTRTCSFVTSSGDSSVEFHQNAHRRIWIGEALTGFSMARHYTFAAVAGFGRRSKRVRPGTGTGWELSEARFVGASMPSWQSFGRRAQQTAGLGYTT